MGDVLGYQGYSGAAISEWELGKSQPRQDERPVLVALLKVLHDCGGLPSLEEANSLLEAGDYRALNAEEINKISAGWLRDDLSGGEDAPRAAGALWRELFWHPRQRAKDLWAQQNGAEGGSRELSQLPLVVVERLLRPWNSTRVLYLVAWVATWLVVWRSSFPLMDWPPASGDAARSAGLHYALGSSLLPLAIGMLAYRREREIWRDRGQTGSGVFFLTSLGALAGFHVGYLSLFALRLFTYYLELNAIPRWLQAVAALWPTLLAYLAARRAPHRFWRAFQELSMTEGDWALLILLLILGPIVGLSFPLIYTWLLSPTVGLAVILGGIGLAALTLTWQRQSGKALLPALFAAVVSLFFVLQQDNLLEIVVVTGVTLTVVAGLVEEKVQGTLAGIFTALVAVGFTGLLRSYDPFAARLMAILVVLLWALWGRKHLWFPVSFWVVVVAAVGCFYLLEWGPWNEVQIAIAFTLVAAINLILANFFEAPRGSVD